MVHRARRLRTAVRTDDARRNTGDRGVMRDRFEHNGPGGNTRAMPDLDVAEDLGARADQYAAADFRMTITRLLTGPAQRNLLQHRHVVLDHCSLAYDQTSGMIEEDSASDADGRIDVGLEYCRRAALQIVGEILAAFIP